MGYLLNSMLGLLFVVGSMTETAQTRMHEPAELVFRNADSEVALTTKAFKAIFGDEHYDWDVDLDEGVIRFTSATKVVSAPVQVVGTYNTLDKTFLWGWDHPSVPEPLGADARLAREFGERQNLPMFTQRKVKCTQKEAWRFTNVAHYLTGAKGAYRAPTGTTMVFMTFGEMTVTPVD